MPKLLVVDRDLNFRCLVRERLSDAYDVCEADNPHDAADLALRMRPDCVLMELLSPALSGLELYGTLRAISFTRPVSVFLTDAAPAATHPELWPGIDLNYSLAKPIDFDQLRTRLDTALQLKRPERRREARVRLQIALKLCGFDFDGIKIEFQTKTDDVSARGFHCSLPTTLPRDKVLLVFCLTGRERFVGSARVVYGASKAQNAMLEHGFEFVEKPTEWILS
jgi:DNA-binding response OmpR family regulator